MVAFCVDIILRILTWILIIQAILSWFVGPFRGRASGAIAQIYSGISFFTYPITWPARAILAKVNTGPMDFSLFLTVLFLIAIREIVLRIA
ncbi:MAG: YggT family protein [Clostridiales Family XIII bacterium]|jgi:uncharacterized protein YggT (Ycf19 family)|nr:YggT family protein [Clostridiales Family XIII bacterium]